MFGQDSQRSDNGQPNNQRGISSKNFLNKLNDEKDKYDSNNINVRTSQGNYM